MNEKDRRQRLAVAEAATMFNSGRMSRRQFIRSCAEAGFSLTSLYFLSSCKQEKPQIPDSKKIGLSAGPQSAIESASDQSHFLKEIGRKFPGTTLRVISEDTPPSRAISQMLKDEFIALTGIHVEWELLPLDRVLAKTAADTARKTGMHDIFYWDQSWVSRFAEDSVNIRELLEKKDLAYPAYNFSDILPPLVENIASHKDRLVGIPFDIPIFIMMYRKDIFDELQLTVPTTMDEYLKTIKAIQSAKAPKMYGTTGQWKSGHYALECDMTAWLWSHGGSFFNTAGQPALKDGRAEAALNYMLELGKYMPPGVTTWDWSSQAASFAQGLAGIYISWGEFFPSFDDPLQSKIVGLAEAAPCPKEVALRTKSECGFGENPGISHQGGSCLAISRHSKNISAAWVLLQWATSADITTRACVLGGGSSPIRKSNYDDPRIIENKRIMSSTTRHLDVTLDAIVNRMGTEPHLPEWANLAVDSFAVELGKLTTGQQDVKSTLNNMSEAAEKVSARNTNRSA
jgi:multiple sugar transport system substrate-binding protein